MAQAFTKPHLTPLKELRPNDFPLRLQGYSAGVLLVLPLRVGGHFWGFAEALIPETLLSHAVLDSDFLASYALFLAIAIKNGCAFAKTSQLAISDDCTTLHNARFLEKCLEDEVCRAERYSHPLVCLFLDLDYFIISYTYCVFRNVSWNKIS